MAKRIKIRSPFVQTDEKIGIPYPFATVKYYDHTTNIKVDYNYVDYDYLEYETIKPIVEALFDEYYKTLEQPVNSSEEKQEIALKAIASLFQKLEWLHPFEDGQGRTDLILLSKLLVEQGFNPAIFYEPYFSSTSTFNEWLDYLKQGIENWQQERLKLDKAVEEEGLGSV